MGYGDEMTSGERLTEAMERKGVSAYRIERDTGISAVTIRRLMAGDGNGYVWTWNVLCRYLGIKIGDIFDG